MEDLTAQFRGLARCISTVSYYTTINVWTLLELKAGEKRNVYRILIGKSDGKRPLLRPGRNWEVKNIHLL